MKRGLKLLVAVGVAALLAGLLALLSQREEPLVRARLVALAGDTSGYLRAEGPVPLEFPADHGPHRDYQTEWWYYTGNLKAEDGQRFGYQLTLFRRALAPPSQRTARESAWAADQVYMGHLALTDVDGKRHQAFERFSRGAAGLAGAQASPYRVWLEGWSVEEIAPGTVRLRAAQQGWALDLLLADQNGPTLHGDRAYSPKGSQPGNASYYYSLTRLESKGTVQVPGAVHSVDGWSWMDHEWSTSALAAGQVGWDWFSLHLDDGSELMVFQLRKEDGRIDPFSSGTFVAPDGSTRHLSRDDFQIHVKDTWRSPHTGASYPAAWLLSVPDVDLRLEIEPYVADQELILSYAYWEGAVQAGGERAGQRIGGSGYVEMTGYAASMQGQF